MCVRAAAAGRLGSRRDWWHLRGCQQQIQTDGLWLCQVGAHNSLSFSLSAHPCLCNTVMGRKLGCMFVCIGLLQRLIVVHVWFVCVQCENLSVCVYGEPPSVCLCNLPGWQEFLFLVAPHSTSYFFFSTSYSMSCSSLKRHTHTPTQTQWSDANFRVIKLINLLFWGISHSEEGSCAVIWWYVTALKQILFQRCHHFSYEFTRKQQNNEFLVVDLSKCCSNSPLQTESGA